MFETLKLEYVDLLTQNDLFNSLIGYLVTISGESSGDDEQKEMDGARDHIQKDMEVVGLAQHWTR